MCKKKYEIFKFINEIIAAQIFCSSHSMGYDSTDIGWGHHIDIVLKASCDGGKTWSQDELMVAKGGSRIAFFSYLKLFTSSNRSSPYRSHISPCDLSSDDCLLGLISLGRYGVEPRRVDDDDIFLPAR